MRGRGCSGSRAVKLSGKKTTARAVCRNHHARATGTCLPPGATDADDQAAEEALGKLESSRFARLRPACAVETTQTTVARVLRFFKALSELQVLHSTRCSRRWSQGVLAVAITELDIPCYFQHHGLKFAWKQKL
jgi:hypothetical protein